MYATVCENENIQNMFTWVPECMDFVSVCKAHLWEEECDQGGVCEETNSTANILFLKLGGA